MTDPFIQTLSSLAVSQTLAQTSTPTAPQKKRSTSRLSVPKSSSLTASGPATLCCPRRLSWVTASTTCASTMACRRRSVTTWRRTLRPVRVPESPSAGGTAPSAVSYSNSGWQFKRRRDCSFCLSYFILIPLQPCPALQTATTLIVRAPAPPHVLTSSPSSATSLQPLALRAASATPATSSVTTTAFVSTNAGARTQMESTMMWVKPNPCCCWLMTRTRVWCQKCTLLTIVPYKIGKNNESRSAI